MMISVSLLAILIETKNNYHTIINAKYLEPYNCKYQWSFIVACHEVMIQCSLSSLRDSTVLCEEAKLTVMRKVTMTGT